MARRLTGLGSVFVAALAGMSAVTAQDRRPASLKDVFAHGEFIVLGDVKHGVAARIAFFSSEALFAQMADSGVRFVAIEMPRVLGRQAMGVETVADVEAFAQDVIRSERWHFVDPDHPGEESDKTQHRVATAMARQVLLAKQYGIHPIFYDFNNPLGGFRTFRDPVYRCLAELHSVAWLKYGLDKKVSKADRDAAIMRERFAHDDELAAFIENEVKSKGGGKLVVIPGYAHAALPGGLADRLEQRLRARPAVVGIFANEAEDAAFVDFLEEQARLLQVDLSRGPQYRYRISTGALVREAEPERFIGLDHGAKRQLPAVCNQIAAAE